MTREEIERALDSRFLQGDEVINFALEMVRRHNEELALMVRALEDKVPTGSHNKVCPVTISSLIREAKP